MTAPLTTNRKILALLCAFVMLLSVNIFLQFDMAEELFDETFSSQTVALQPAPEICGSRALMSSSVPCTASWATLPALVTSSHQTIKLQYIFSFVSWASFEAPISKPALSAHPTLYISALLFAPSGLAPPVA